MKEVYNGYFEKFLSGYELKEMFKNSFYCSGRHHSVVYGATIEEYLTSLKIKDNNEYRIFYNEHFCKIMNAKTDKDIVFFGHTELRNLNTNILNALKEIPFCPICNATMILKEGKYGVFRSCSKYPECKGASKVPIIKNL